MAQISIAEIYSGEKHGVMSATMAEYIKDGRPLEYNERTWVDLLLVKHTLIAAKK